MLVSGVCGRGVTGVNVVVNEVVVERDVVSDWDLILLAYLMSLLLGLFTVGVTAAVSELSSGWSGSESLKFARLTCAEHAGGLG